VKDVGRLPRFPYGGTNRIRFKGYNLSRMAPPSKMLINAVGIIPDKNLLQLLAKSAANLQHFCKNATITSSPQVLP
jgi:hypothetical protein